MAFEDDEQSKHAGRPVELFKYEGTYDNYYYTSGPALINYDGNDYVPIATKRSALNVQTQNDDNSEVTIELPVSSQLIAVYGFQIAPPDLALTIYRGHNGDFVRAWSGNVENIQVIKGTASVRVPSDLASALNADFPNVYYQGPCNHALFDARCGIEYADWSFATEVTANAGVSVTLDGIGTLTGQLVGGDAVLASGERRMIIGQAGNVITLNYPFAQIAATDVIIIAAGCDLSWAGDCNTRFNNQLKFGGFPFITSKNIFSTGLEPGKDVSDIACNPTNNLGFEKGDFSGWFVSPAMGIRTITPNGNLSHGGTYHAWGGVNTFSTLWRETIVPSSSFAKVDSGLVKCEGFSCWHETLVVQTDQGRLFVQFLDGSNSIISTEYSAWESPANWTLRTMPQFDLPAGTRKIKWGVESDRLQFTENDNYWDDFTALRLVL